MSDRLFKMLGKMTGGPDQYSQGLRKMLEHLRGAAYNRDDLIQAFAFFLSHASEAKGQLFQDLWALWVSGQKRGGFFVEFGAADGVFLSNTWLLENRYGWTGILAEPNPTSFEALARNRGCAVSNKCVYSRTGERLEFVATRQPEYSGLTAHNERMSRRGGPRLMVETISLNDLLLEHNAPRQIDYMSLDTEGSELEILSTFDFDRWDVRAFSIEEGGNREALAALLSPLGYERRWQALSCFDDWYIRV
jgi:FkbM family methyltransferase